MFPCDRGSGVKRRLLARSLARVASLVLLLTDGAPETTYGACPQARGADSYLGAQKDLLVYFMG